MKQTKYNNTYKYQLASDDEKESSDLFLGFHKRQRPVTDISFSIDEYVRDPKYYRQIVEELGGLTEEDSVQIKINSGGGDLFGLVALLEAIRMCDANVLAIITGSAHSAASMLALSCPNVAVTPTAHMLVHFVSFGSGGKSQDVVQHVTHIKGYAEKLFRSIYKDFLTEKEMQEVIEGKELWFGAEEIERRLKVRSEKNLREYQKATKANKKKVEKLQEAAAALDLD